MQPRILDQPKISDEELINIFNAHEKDIINIPEFKESLSIDRICTDRIINQPIVQIKSRQVTNDYLSNPNYIMFKQ